MVNRFPMSFIVHQIGRMIVIVPINFLKFPSPELKQYVGHTTLPFLLAMQIAFRAGYVIQLNTHFINHQVNSIGMMVKTILPKLLFIIFFTALSLLSELSEELEL